MFNDMRPQARGTGVRRVNRLVLPGLPRRRRSLLTRRTGLRTLALRPPTSGRRPAAT